MYTFRLQLQYKLASQREPYTALERSGRSFHLTYVIFRLHAWFRIRAIELQIDELYYLTHDADVWTWTSNNGWKIEHHLIRPFNWRRSWS